MPELSYLYVHEKYWLCKYVKAAPLPDFIYKYAGHEVWDLSMWGIRDDDGDRVMFHLELAKDKDDFINDEL
jgi:3'-phosphoadenosine 5'-phosphosulfate sulfotransferase (PAPS reductase)/FAD synthetase